VLRKDHVPLETVIDMALESSRPVVNAAGHHLSVLLPTEGAAVEADASRLAQVFATLLKNAAKHVRARGSIGLTATIEGAEVAVAVEDSGIGLEPEAAARLFQGGRMAPEDTARLGVGLTLVQGIVTLHGGRIEAKSRGAGQGSEFIVRLPLAQGRPVTERKPRRVIPEAPVSLRVLVADDNRDAADSLQRILTLYGHEVRVAYDGATALQLGEQFRPRVAVLDIGMPAPNGYEVARAIRQRLGGEVKLVALTGWGQDGDRKRALEAGFDHHLTKPVDPGALNELLTLAGS